VTRRIRSGHERAYEEFLAGITGAANAFPGYLGAEIFRPTGSGTIFPLITLIVVVSAPVIGGLSLAARLAVTTLVAVSLMTWVIMPRVTRLLRGWLYPRGED
jgi:antibiotic biosynthesis monooxygenase (ABM) superfamily enzyme